MIQLGDEIINNPAKEGYLFNFSGGIFGDYAPGQETHMYELVGTKMTSDEVLVDLEMPENLLKKRV